MRARGAKKFISSSKNSEIMYLLSYFCHPKQLFSAPDLTFSIQTYGCKWDSATTKTKGLHVVILPNEAFYYDQCRNVLCPTNFLFRYVDQIEREYGSVGFVLCVPRILYGNRDDGEKNKKENTTMPPMPGIMTISQQQNLEMYKDYKSVLNDTTGLPLFHLAENPTIRKKPPRCVTKPAQYSLKETNSPLDLSIEDISIIVPKLKCLGPFANEQSKKLDLSQYIAANMLARDLYLFGATMFVSCALPTLQTFMRSEGLERLCAMWDIQASRVEKTTVQQWLLA